MFKNNLQPDFGTAQEVVYSDPEYCIYEGPKDKLNYWGTFRSIAEDYKHVQFIQIFTEVEEFNIPNNTITCHDASYNTTVTLKDNTDVKKLDQFLLYRFIFRNTIRLNDNLWEAARKARQPILVYLRGSYQGGLYSKKDVYVHHQVGLNQTLKEEFQGQSYIIDFALHQSYQ